MSTAVLESPLEEALAALRAAQRSSGVWMQTLSHLDPAYGGLTAVVPALAARLRQQLGTAMPLAAFCAPGENDAGNTQSMAVPRQDVSIWPAGHARWLTDRKLTKRFAEALGSVDGVHVHGLWDAGTRVAAHGARNRNKPYVVSAHGMLEPWALAQKAAKKRVYSALVVRPALQRAACLHALTTAEADDYRRFGCTQPIAIIPNAVEAPRVIDEHLIEARFPQITGRRVVLFLGRLHAKKGIELLLQAWSALRMEHPDTSLMIAGPGEDSYVHSLQLYAAELDMREQVVFAGMLDHASKWSALRRAHVFVLPSYSEGLSVAALESLCAGTPVIVTEACHLPEVKDADCGWQIKTDMQQLQGALRESLESNSSQQRLRSVNARSLAATRFTWDVVCKQMAELYACVLGGGTPKLSAYQEATR